MTGSSPSGFNYPGLSKLAAFANSALDLPTLIGLVLAVAAFMIAGNVIVDSRYATIDPRVRVG